jgi:hypothetical protein
MPNDLETVSRALLPHLPSPLTTSHPSHPNLRPTHLPLF